MDNNVRMPLHRAHPRTCRRRAGQDALGREATARNTGTTLTLALNYGGRSELVDAFRGLMPRR
jgi:undecaprenyl diphosphate synthase